MPTVEMKHVTKVLSKRVILDDISLRFTPGMIYGLRGKNGCGKTMLMRTICGFIRPTQGEVFINSQRLYKELDFPPSIGALIESPSFLDEYTGQKNLELLQSLYGKVKEESILCALKRVGLYEQKDQKYEKYSLGMKQKLGIAYAILDEPDIIVLDEPINALDEESVWLIRNILLELRSKEKIIIIACHDREELNYLSDKVYLMRDGKIVGEEDNFEFNKIDTI